MKQLTDLSRIKFYFIVIDLLMIPGVSNKFWKKVFLLKVIRILVTFLMIVFCVCTCCFPAFASSSIYVGTSLVKSSSEFSFYFGGLDPNASIYSQGNSGTVAFPGYISNVSGSREFDVYFDNDYITKETAEVIYGFSNDVLFKLVSNVSNDEYTIYNSSNSIEYVLNQGGSEVKHQVAFLRYISHAFQVSSFKPTYVDLHSDSVVLASESYYRTLGGYGGFILPYLHDHEFPDDNIPYNFSATVTSTSGLVTEITHSGFVTKDSNNVLYAPLIPSDVFSLIPASALVSDISIEYTLSTLDNIPAGNNAWTFYTVYDIAASDNGDYSSGVSNFYYDNYDFPFELFLSEREFGLSGSYNDGYNDGKADGYDEGFVAGRIEGQAQGYQDGLADGKNLGFESGRTQGYSEGYEAGDLAGYDRGYSAGDLAGYDRGYAAGDHVGYERGQIDGFTAGDLAGYERGYAIGERTGYSLGYDVGYQTGIVEGIETLDFTSWLGTAVGGFMDFQIFSNITIGGILAVCIGMALVMMFLKFFAGG